VTARLLLVTHLPTQATRAARFPADEPADPAPAGWSQGWSPRDDAVVLRGPERRCADTCSAVGLAADLDPALREWDLGSWRGRALDEVAADALSTWSSDSDVAAHGGESLTGLLARTKAWLERRTDGVTIAVTSPAVVRAVLVTALDVEAAAFWRFDVAPATVSEVSGRNGRWSVRSVGADPASVPALHRT
jgi:broad specificity phosphatase PhoE